MKILVVCSGGMDSVTLAYKVATEHELTRLLSFDYGQRHKKELEYAARIAGRLKVRHDVVDISNVAQFLTGSALTDTKNAEVPDGHYTEENMKVTVVPNRNAIMLAVAYGVAAGEGAGAVALAIHSGDHFIYPDCRPAFVDAFRAMENRALEGMWEVDLYSPFSDLTKANIAGIGEKLSVPYEDTWSCYRGEDLHCGRCGTCVERQEAFHVAGVADPTVYADPDYWREVCLASISEVGD